MNSEEHLVVRDLREWDLLEAAAPRSVPYRSWTTARIVSGRAMGPSPSFVFEWYAAVLIVRLRIRRVRSPY